MGRDINKSQFIIGGISIAVLIVLLIAYLTYSNKVTRDYEDYSKTDTQEDFESTSTEMGKTVQDALNELDDELENETEKETNNTENKTTNTTTNTKNNKTTNTTTNGTKPTSTNAETNVEKKDDEKEDKEENKEPKFVVPVSGEIIRGFASDALVYSNTLDEWITHNGVDIKADKTSVVTASASGTVYAIKNDPRYCLTVIINHDGGYQTVYANLLTAEFVVEGEKVEAGQTIGTVGNTASFEISDDYHLHFEVLKNDKCIDPTTCIDFK